MTSSAHLCVIASLTLATHNSCANQVAAFTPPVWSSIFRYKSNAGGNSNFSPPPPPPPPASSHYSHGESDDDENAYNPTFLFSAAILNGDGSILNGEEECSEETKDLTTSSKEDVDQTEIDNDLNNADGAFIQMRGGASSNTADIMAGAKSTLETTTTFWSITFDSLSNTLQTLNPFQRNKSKQSNDDKDDDDGIDPTTIRVRAVTAPQSDILPDSIIRSSAQRSGIIGSVMRADRINDCARQLKEWYVKRGYVLHSVTGATLHTENATAILNVQEPLSSSTPINILFAKEVPIDPETGETTSMRKYRAKVERKRGRALKSEEWTKITKSLNTTLIETKGRTNPQTLAKRLGLHGGEHFCWNARRWQSIAQSGIFSKIWRSSPAQMQDGSVQLQVLAQESPPRNLEYGISKSLYTGHWEGELDFKHENLLGGGESLGLIVRRGTKDAEPSITLRFTDDKFGMKGGYDAELFTDCIAVNEVKVKDDDNDDKNTLAHETETQINTSQADDALLSRKGLKFSLRGPIPSKLVQRSSASALIERTSTRQGRHETIGSSTLRLGPFINYLPLGAKSSVTTRAAPGVRCVDRDGSYCLLPYGLASATTRQLFPLFTDNSSRDGREVKLALEHTVTSATTHLPLHEANAVGFAARVRGYGNTHGPIDSSIVGSAEIRIPVTIPKIDMEQDASVVIFGDWMFAHQKETPSNGGDFGKSSIGIGLRKSIQGIGLKYDISVTKDGRIGAFFGLGGDWDITE